VQQNGGECVSSRRPHVVKRVNQSLPRFPRVHDSSMAPKKTKSEAEKKMAAKIRKADRYRQKKEDHKIKMIRLIMRLFQ
ncbi:hypothetical protein GE061_000868, partial [Apolygus lucorum]